MSDTLQTKPKQTFNHLPQRLIAAIVMVLLSSVLIIPGMATYLPFHENDNIGLPILFFPFIWAGLFIYCFVEQSIKRLWSVLVGLTVVHILCIYLALAG